MNKKEIFASIISLVIGTIGWVALVYFFEWKLTLVIFLIIFANNIDTAVKMGKLKSI